MNKFLYYLALIIEISTLSFLTYEVTISGHYYYNGLSFLVLLFITMIYPLNNFLGFTKYQVRNNYYYILNIIISIYILYIIQNAIKLYFHSYTIDFGNESNLYIFNKLDIMYGLLILSIIIYKFIKKDKKRYTILSDNFLYFLIFLIGFSPLLSDSFSLQSAISIGIGSFYLIYMLMNQHQELEESDIEVSKLIILILTLYSQNFLLLILLLILFLRKKSF